MTNYQLKECTTMDADNEAMVRALEAAGHHDAARVIRAMGNATRPAAVPPIGQPAPPAGERFDPETQRFMEQLEQAQSKSGWSSTTLDGRRID